MNKYQEALNNFVQNAKGEPVIVGSYDEMVLQELVDKEEKYKWHNIRQNPSDLPKHNFVIYAVYDPEAESYYYEVVNFLYSNVKRIHLDGKIDIAWKYIEGF